MQINPKPTTILGNLTSLITKSNVDSIKGEQTVICTELYRQGMMNKEIYLADKRFGQYIITTKPNVMIGYHFLAKPVVKLMKKSKIITIIVCFIAAPWAKEMAYQMEKREKGNIVGKIIMSIGMFICEIVGKIIEFKYNIERFLMINLILFFLIILIELFGNRKKKKLKENLLFKERL